MQRFTRSAWCWQRLCEVLCAWSHCYESSNQVPTQSDHQNSRLSTRIFAFGSLRILSGDTHSPYLVCDKSSYRGTSKFLESKLQASRQYSDNGASTLRGCWAAKALPLYRHSRLPEAGFCLLLFVWTIECCRSIAKCRQSSVLIWGRGHMCFKLGYTLCLHRLGPHPMRGFSVCLIVWLRSESPALQTCCSPLVRKTWYRCSASANHHRSQQNSQTFRSSTLTASSPLDAFYFSNLLFWLFGGLLFVSCWM